MLACLELLKVVEVVTLGMENGDAPIVDRRSGAFAFAFAFAFTLKPRGRCGG